METSIQQQMILIITDQGKLFSKNKALAGVWIREYPPLPPDADHIDSKAVPVAVWYLDRNGLQSRTPEDWALFLNQRDKLKMMPSFPPKYTVGMAAFAPYREGDYWYFEEIWGPRFAAGWHWVIQEGKLHGRDKIWIS